MIKFLIKLLEIFFILYFKVLAFALKVIFLTFFGSDLQKRIKKQAERDKSYDECIEDSTGKYLY